MWSYYGAKTKVIKHYPKPIHDVIIEPFAGTARYALEYFEKEVILIDSFNKISDIWSYLINVSEKELMDLPDLLEPNADLRNYSFLSDPEKWLIGYCIGRGSARPRNKPGKFNSWPLDKKRISENLFKIRHWKIKNGSFLDQENVEATWFIDPPYQIQVHRYSKQILNYSTLSDWCMERKGQIIVCENEGGEWMDFKPLVSQKGISKKTIEYIFTK